MMIPSSLPSQVDQVRSLFFSLQDSLTALPTENLNQVLSELEHIVNKLRGQAETNHKHLEPLETAHPSANQSTETSQGSGENEPWLDHALEQARAAAWTWDLVQNTVKWSSDLYDLLRIDPANEISDPQTFFDMIHPAFRETATHEIMAAIERGGRFTIEFCIIRGDGKTIWLSSSGTFDRDPSGRTVQASGINQDITARKLAEIALRKSEERERAKAAELQALMDAVPALIWISRDPECKEMIGNRYGYEFLNMWEGANVSKTAPDMELGRQPFRNFKHGKEIPSREMPMQIAASTGVGTSNFEFDLVFDNGVTKNLLGNVLPLIDQNGKPAGAVAAFVDITERKRIENDLIKSEARLRMWKNYISFWNKATNSFFWILAPDGTYLDPILTDPGISGKPLDKTRGSSWIDSLHPEDQGTTRILCENAIRQQSAFEVESRVWHNESQQYRWFSHRAVPMFEEGVLKGWIGASTDIQAHKELEQVLKEDEIHMATQRQLLETRENERGKIARDIHDGPIQTLISTLFNLHDLKEDIVDPFMKAGLEPIRDSLKYAVDELRQVVNELRPQSLARFGLVKAIRRQAGDIREKLPELDLRLDLSEDKSDFSEQISLTLYRICQEALNNVIRHSQATTATVHLSFDEDRVVLEVEDNGVGFPVSNDFAKLTEGKHFGLAGMKERAEAFGGSIQVLSEPGYGTTIKVAIPLASDNAIKQG